MNQSLHREPATPIDPAPGAGSRSDPLNRSDLARLLYGYVAGTGAIAIFGSLIVAAEIYPRPEHTILERWLMAIIALGVPFHIPALLVIHRMGRRALQRYAFWLILGSTFFLTAMIYLSGVYTAIVGVLIFTELGMATLILPPRVAGAITLTQFLQILAVVALERTGVLPHQTLMVALFDFHSGYLQTASLLLLLGGAMGTIYSWMTYVRRRFDEVHQELAALAVTDKLTGLPNRRSFDEALFREVARAKRLGRPLSLLMCDADHFKLVNDTYGHAKGDEVLRRVADVILGSVRVGVDLPARIGGEEFAVILSDSELNAASAVAERIVETMRQLRFEAHGAHFGVTLSIGVTSIGGEEADTELLLEAADVLLYRAKNGGRDRVVGQSVAELQQSAPENV